MIFGDLTKKVEKHARELAGPDAEKRLRAADRSSLACFLVTSVTFIPPSITDICSTASAPESSATVVTVLSALACLATVVPSARAVQLTMDREGIRRLAAEEHPSQRGLDLGRLLEHHHVPGALNNHAAGIWNGPG